MCWITKSEKCVTAKIAESDIPVFKLVDVGEAETPDSGVPYFRSVGLKEEDLMEDETAGGFVMRYAAGHTYRANGFTAPKIMFRTGEYFADRGVHSYSPDVTLEADGGDVPRPLTVRDPGGRRIVRADGYAFPYDWLYEWRRSESKRVQRCVPGVMDCVIPEGTKYLVNERGEYVSERIRVTGFRTVADKCAEGGSKKRSKI